jgi:parallel beta-helix repeat protein
MFSKLTTTILISLVGILIIGMSAILNQVNAQTLESPWQNIQITNFITGDDNYASEPDIAWDGSKYGLVWTGKKNTPNAELFFSILDLNGNKQGNDIRLTNHDDMPSNVGVVGLPQIVWNGSEYGILWSDNDGSGQRIKFMRLDALGTKLSDVFITGSNDNATMGGGNRISLIWTDSEYVAVWHGTQPYNGGWNYEIYFARINSAGNSVLAKSRVTYNKYSSVNPSIAWDGNSYGIVWSDGTYAQDANVRDIYFTRVDSEGNKLLDDIRLTDVRASNSARADNSHIFWDGYNYSIIWKQRSNDSNIDGAYYVKVDSFGNKIIANKKISATTEGIRLLSVVRSENTYGLVWSSIQLGNSIYFKIIDINGNTVANDKIINDISGENDHPDIVWNGVRYGVVWHNIQNNRSQLYFATNKELTSKTIYVPDDYSTIQTAVDVADSGDIIVVKDGIYTENINVNKPYLTIKSENGADSTIVQAADPDDHVFEIMANSTYIIGFTVKGATGCYKSGIYLVRGVEDCVISYNKAKENNYGGIRLLSSNSNTISNNVAMENGIGIFLFSSNNNTIRNNDFSNNSTGSYLQDSNMNLLEDNVVNLNGIVGLQFWSSNSNNIIRRNTFSENGWFGAEIYENNNSNTFYLNDFSNNRYNIHICSSTTDNSSTTDIYHSPEPINYTYDGNTYTSYLGNYWSDYFEVDADGDGIGDTHYSINSDKDNYPLMYPFENYIKGEVPLIPSEFWVKVKEDGICIYQDETLTTKLKCLPQGWILKILNPEGEWKDYNDVPTTTQIVDVTDNFSGWTNKNFLNYDLNKQNEWETKTRKIRNIKIIPQDFVFVNDLSYGIEGSEVKYLQVVLSEEGSDVYPESIISGKFYSLTKGAVERFQKKYQEEYGLPITGSVTGVNTKEALNKRLTICREEYANLSKDRTSVIFNTAEKMVDNPPSWLPADFLGAEAPFRDKISFVLAIVAQETGPYYNWNNEIVAADWGRGIMQITYDSLVGSGSSISCFPDKCKAREDWESCKNHYTNTIQGIGANMKDGLWALQDLWSYTYRNYRATCCVDGQCDEAKKLYCCKDKSCQKYNETQCDITSTIITCRDVRQMSTIERYNIGTGKKKFTKYVNEDLEDQTGVAYHLKRLGNTNHFGDVGVEYENPTFAQKLVFAANNSKEIRLMSPADLQVYDFQGRSTGIVDGKIQEEIPSSLYDETHKSVLLLFPENFYSYKIVGTGEGIYGLSIDSTEGGMLTTFNATDIPTTPGQVHRYTIDWEALLQGEKGVTLQIDADGDGEFEQIITADSELASDEFILQTETVVDFVPDTLNLKSKGKFITAYIELPERYEISQIDVSSIILNDLVSALSEPTEIGDYNNNGIPDLLIKFDRQKVQESLDIGENVEMMITGELFHNGDDIDFKGSDTIRVINFGEGKNKNK